MKKFIYPILMLVGIMLSLTSCDDSKSYAELLEDENYAVNKFLVQHRVVDGIPADSVFEVGENAPYYRLDEESNVYMQVLSLGTDEKPQADDRVYFRCNMYNMFYYRIGDDEYNSYIDEGNATGSASPAFFLFENTTVSESTQHGTGIQLPMRFLGYNAKVNLIVKSQAGATSTMSYVIPYLYTISYFKSQI